MADRKIYSGRGINSGKLDWSVSKHASSAFTGGSANTHGDHDGTADPYTIFTVTGVVAFQAFFGICNTALVGAATLEVGVTANTGLFCPQHADVSATINANTIVGVVNAAKFGDQINATFRDNVIIVNGTATNIIETIGAANITAGQIDYYCVWAPISTDGNVVSA
jgi:hypothetical protein